MVEEFENALPLEAFLKNGGGPYNDTLAEVGLDAFLVSSSRYIASPTYLDG